MPRITRKSLTLALLAFIASSTSRQITIKNSCRDTIYPGLFTGGTATPTQPTGWKMTPGQTVAFVVDDSWTAGRVWARTGCTEVSGRLECLTGACGGDGMVCQGTGQPPATLAEFTLASDGVDHYDISLVDGFNVPISIHPSEASCKAPTCEVNINALCPMALRAGIDDEGRNLGCLSACTAGLGQVGDGNRACCSGSYNDPEKCAICGVDYYALFKDSCKDAYAVGACVWTRVDGSTRTTRKYANSTANCGGGGGGSNGGLSTWSSASIRSLTVGHMTSAEGQPTTATFGQSSKTGKGRPTSPAHEGGNTRTRFGNAAEAWQAATTAPSTPSQSARVTDDVDVDQEAIGGSGAGGAQKEMGGKGWCLRRRHARR